MEYSRQKHEYAKSTQMVRDLIEKNEKGKIKFMDDTGSYMLGWVRYDNKNKIVNIEGLRSDRNRMKRILQKAKVI